MSVNSRVTCSGPQPQGHPWLLSLTFRIPVPSTSESPACDLSPSPLLMTTSISITIIPHQVPPVASWGRLLNSALPLCSSLNNLSDCHCTQREIRLCHSTAYKPSFPEHKNPRSHDGSQVETVCSLVTSLTSSPVLTPFILLQPPWPPVFLRLARQTSSLGPLHWPTLLHGNFLPCTSTCFFFFGSFLITFSATPFLTTCLLFPSCLLLPSSWVYCWVCFLTLFFFLLTLFFIFNVKNRRWMRGAILCVLFIWYLKPFWVFPPPPR